MRKNLIFIIAAIFAFALFHFTSFLFRPSEPIGIVDGLKFNMGPRTIIRMLGKPTSTTDYMDSFKKMYYTFDVELDSVPTKLGFEFHLNRQLYTVYADADAGSQENANQLFETWREKMIVAYEDYKGFYCNDKHISSETSYYQKLGINMGAEGVDCTIKVDGSTVTLSCTRAF